MKPSDDEAFLVLNAAHLNKMAGPDAIAAATAVAPATVASVLDDAEAAGLGQRAGTQFLLFPEGSKQVLAHYDRLYGDLRRSPATIAWYERFETLNTRFIGLVTEWQTSAGDAAVEAKLIKVVQRLVKAIETLTLDIPRYAHYVRRFGDAVAKTDQGTKDFVCSPMVDSIHNVWFEFHEDILSVLGRPRDTT